MQNLNCGQESEFTDWNGILIVRLSTWTACPAGWGSAAACMVSHDSLVEFELPQAIALYTAIRSSMFVSDNMPFLFTNGARLNCCRKADTDR